MTDGAHTQRLRGVALTVSLHEITHDLTQSPHAGGLDPPPRSDRTRCVELGWEGVWDVVQELVVVHPASDLRRPIPQHRNVCVLLLLHPTPPPRCRYLHKLLVRRYHLPRPTSALTSVRPRPTSALTRSVALRLNMVRLAWPMCPTWPPPGTNPSPCMTFIKCWCKAPRFLSGTAWWPPRCMLRQIRQRSGQTTASSQQIRSTARPSGACCQQIRQTGHRSDVCAGSLGGR
mmetsp:Transcript_47036/g.110827  ORF Transcript_47036/g.110827 Transcript_47036/m.110827 type:complete len:231 (+) Transcript_47036:1354-2046(+)